VTETPGVQSWVPRDAVERLAAALGGTIRPARPAPVQVPGVPAELFGRIAAGPPDDDGDDGQQHD
jgi:hypothetical protein